MKRTNYQIQIEERIIAEARYICATRATLRKCAKAFGRSKSTVHIDMKKRLPLIDGYLYQRVLNVLAYNKSMRSIRGGEATKERFRRMKDEGTM